MVSFIYKIPSLLNSRIYDFRILHLPAPLQLARIIPLRRLTQPHFIEFIKVHRNRHTDFIIYLKALFKLLKVKGLRWHLKMIANSIYNNIWTATPFGYSGFIQFVFLEYYLNDISDFELIFRFRFLVDHLFFNIHFLDVITSYICGYFFVEWDLVSVVKIGIKFRYYSG